MLNELFHLSESLKRSGVNLQSWHRHFKECPQGGRALFVEFDDQGRVAKVSPITDLKVRVGLRKYEKAAWLLVSIVQRATVIAVRTRPGQGTRSQVQKSSQIEEAPRGSGA